MNFLNPFMFWSALAVALPIALHFWHQKKGKILPFAAMQWLVEKDLQQATGFRLDNIWLLLLRCLLLLLLTLFLAKPVLNAIKPETKTTKIHLVQANKLVVDNFRFELETALKNKEKCFWIDNNLNQIQALNPIPVLDFDAYVFQNAINLINEENQKFEFYFLNDKILQNVPQIFVPNRFSLNTVIDSTQKSSFQANITALKPMQVLIQNKKNITAIQATLQAITDVYKIKFEIEENPISSKKQDWVFAKCQSEPVEDCFLQFDEKKIPFELDETSPERFLEILVERYKLNSVQVSLSKQQLQALFKEMPHNQKSKNDTFQSFLLALFLILIAAERWFAIHKNA
jgi:Aerotolerance regulator N-terminal